MRGKTNPQKRCVNLKINKTMKTTLEHLKTLRPDDRDRAITNLDPTQREVERETLAQAVIWAFMHCDTPEGSTFWSNVVEELEQGTYHFTAADSGLPDSGGRSEFTTGAVRDASEGKGLPSHLPTRALKRAAQRFEDGAAKYDAHNWRKGIPMSRYIDSLQRHLWAFQEGDTTEDHLGAITWNAMCLSETYDLIAEGTLPADLNDLAEHQTK